MQWQPTLVLVPRKSNGGEASWPAVHGVAKNRTRLSVFTFTFRFHALEKEMATHSSLLAWGIPGTEEPSRLQSMGSWRVWHDWASSLSLFTFMHWRRKWQPTPVFLPGESQGRGAWWAAIYGVAQSRTWLRQLSSSSSMQKVLWEHKAGIPNLALEKGVKEGFL